MNKKILIFGIVAMCSFLSSVWAGGINAPGGSTSAQRSAAFSGPSSGGSSSSYDLNSVMATLPVSENENSALTANVAADKIFWGLCTDEGSLGIQTSTIPKRWFYDTRTSSLDAWLYSETTSDAVDPDQVEKVWEGGVESTGTGSSGGERICNGILNGSRWCDNRNGTVTDMTTGLVWLQNANCWGLMTWKTAITKPITDLRDGTCGLTDDSEWGDWHLPTLDELYTLAYGPEAVEITTPYAFSGVQSDYYWSSTTHAYHSTHSWYVYFTNGSVNYYSKMKHNYVWPVRSGR